MSKIKSQIEKLIQFKFRSKGNKSWIQKLNVYYKFFFQIADLFDEDNKALKKFAEIGFRYFHVNNVSYIQELYKLFIIQLVDSNHEYARRLVAKHSIKFEIDHFSGVLNKKFTLGEFLSSQYQPNSLEEMAQIYSTIMEEDFYKVFREVIAADKSKEKLKMTEENALELLKVTFEKRHIVAHELNKIETLTYEDYFRYLGIMLHVYNLLQNKSGKKEDKRVGKKTNPNNVQLGLT